MNQYKKVLNEFKKYKSFLLTSHVNPEGDSIGSQLSLFFFLKSMGKRACIYNMQRPDYKYLFLPGTSGIRTKIDKNTEYDAVCFLDCAGIERIGAIRSSIDFSKPKINIDHHISSTYFGDVNLVEPDASSTAEVLYKLFSHAKFKLDKKIAACLYTAILSDTGSFNYSNVTPYTHQVISHLIDLGIDTYKIYKSIYEEIPPTTMRLLASALSTLELANNDKIAWIKITQAMLEQHNARLEDEEDFINFPRSIKGVEVAMLLKEVSKNKTKISFRSNRNVDVNKIASFFGGGGHKRASGCVINKSIKEAEQDILSRVKKYVK